MTVKGSPSEATSICTPSASSQRGMRTPGFDQGRYLVDPDGSGMSEHAVHHFHGLVLDAYEQAVAS